MAMRLCAWCLASASVLIVVAGRDVAEAGALIRWLELGLGGLLGMSWAG